MVSGRMGAAERAPEQPPVSWLPPGLNQGGGGGGGGGGLWGQGGQFAADDDDADSEPPLLEGACGRAHNGGAARTPPRARAGAELGIDFKHIRTKIQAVVTPLKPIQQEILEDSDLAGPLVFVMALGFFLLLVRAPRHCCIRERIRECALFVCVCSSTRVDARRAALTARPPQAGKVHFGYIYGFGITGAFGIYALLNLMCGDAHPADLVRVFSVMGYSLLPIVVLAGVAVVFDLRCVCRRRARGRHRRGCAAPPSACTRDTVARRGVFGIVVAAASIGWATVTSTRFFEKALGMSEQKFLIAYPCALTYACFALITIF